MLLLYSLGKTQKIITCAASTDCRLQYCTACVMISLSFCRELRRLSTVGSQLAAQIPPSARYMAHITHNRTRGSAHNTNAKFCTVAVRTKALSADLYHAYTVAHSSALLEGLRVPDGHRLYCTLSRCPRRAITHAATARESVNRPGGTTAVTSPIQR